MNILFYFYELDTPMYHWWREHVFDELRHYGFNFITFNPAQYKSPDLANSNFIQYIHKERMKIDLFFSCVESKWLYASTVHYVKKKLSIPAILFTADNLELPYKHRDNCSAFDLVWVTSKETEYLFKKWGCKTIFQPYAANPYLYKPSYNIMSIENIGKVGFIGSPYGSRVNKLNFLLQNSIPCRVYSDSLFNKGYNSSLNGKKKIDIFDTTVKFIRYLRFPIGRKVLYSTILNKINEGSKLAYDSPFLEKEHSISQPEMCDLYSRFKLSLNISELRDTYILKKPIHKIHLRTFEIPMCGGLQITSYTDEVSSYFREDKEIVFYSSPEELIDKCIFYLDNKNENLVRQMKKAAFERASKEHTWYNRFTKILQAL